MGNHGGVQFFHSAVKVSVVNLFTPACVRTRSSWGHSVNETHKTARYGLRCNMILGAGGWQSDDICFLSPFFPLRPERISMLFKARAAGQRSIYNVQVAETSVKNPADCPMTAVVLWWLRAGYTTVRINWGNCRCRCESTFGPKQDVQYLYETLASVRQDCGAEAVRLRSRI